MWEHIDQLRKKTKNKEKMINVYNDAGECIEEGEINRRMKDFWEGIYGMHLNKMEEVWSEETEVQYGRNWENQMEDNRGKESELLMIAETNGERIRSRYVNELREHLDMAMSVEKVLLPDGYEYRVCEYSRSAEDIHAVLRLKNTTEDSARLWIKEFQEKTKTTLRCKKKHKADGQKNVFHVQLRCHHNTSPRTHTADLRAGSKNTSCPATLTVIVKRVITSRKSRSSDIHAGLYPMIVKLAYNHNHPVLCSDALKHRDVSEEVKNTFLKLYQANHSPSTALHVHKYDLSEDYSEEFVHAFADRLICPDLQWCYR
ncbi:hypothetical protein Pcinc_006337 [Petrolisthes cinctipes]|uniref:Uncharacterized protein n=1 Tax=Petrolisthes cinctipes TaxID=88211 RepID=A0AAE1KY77_PETCI|nr:hypothetical protein Pcinc_006337 [Petrolisthes cinctipes]